MLFQRSFFLPHILDHSDGHGLTGHNRKLHSELQRGSIGRSTLVNMNGLNVVAVLLNLVVSVFLDIPGFLNMGSEVTYYGIGEPLDASD